VKLLVIGSGGREHAIAWKLAQSAKVTQVYVAPGNGGTAYEPKVQNIALNDHQALADFAQREGVRFTVVGPEAPLAAGIVDYFQTRKLAIFGPTRAAAQLESSKDFAKQFMTRMGIPTAAYQSFSDADAAHRYVQAQGAPIVIKADGLAAGKGVVVAHTLEEAHQAIDGMLKDHGFGEAGARVVIEACLSGEEASFIAMVDGEHVLALASSQDHKRLGDADTGPNTGGMGAYSPAPVVTPDVHAFVMREVITKAVKGMAAEGHRYVGFLYAGLMIDPQKGVKVLEFNCRLGDPETQPLLVRLRSDLVDLIEAALAGRLNQIEAQWDRRHAVGVVLAAKGYPQSPRTGDPVRGLLNKGAASSLGQAKRLADPAGLERLVFHAGTEDRAGELLSSGGRVLCAVGLGDSVKLAQQHAYESIAQIRLEGGQYRKDIAWRARRNNGTQA
jgi:phosphoribosylamine--glycine ligase